MNSDKLTDEIKELAKKSGAALIGVASIDRFDPIPPYYDRVPKGEHPRDFLPEARSVISIAMPILNPAIDAPARLNEMELEMFPKEARSRWLDAFYGRVAHFSQDVFLLLIGQILGQYLLAQGYDAMIFPTEGVHFEGANGRTERQIMMGESKEWAKKNSPFRYISGPISHRHCATRAGLGEFGYNNLVLTKEFGARQRFNTIVTEAELIPDPLISKPICLRDACRLCLKACHMGAIFMRDDASYDDYRSVPKVDKDIIFIDTPAKTNNILCRDRMVGNETFPIRGDCVRVCPLPKVPRHLTKRLQHLVDQWQH
jgi:epoxyqueuosine reductase QueG